MIQINVALDLYSSAVCLILFAHLVVQNRRLRPDKLRSCFILMCAFNAAMSLCDITNWTCEGLANPWNPALLWSGSLLYWLCAAPLLLAFTAYLIAFLEPRVQPNRWFWRTAVALCALHMAGCILSIWTGLFFDITEGNYYERGPLFGVSQAIPAAIYLLDVILFVRYREALLRKDFWMLSSYIILPVLAEIVQILNYGIGLLNTGVTIALLIIFISVQTDRELRLERQEKALAEARIDTMLSQIQPHFLYSVLTTIHRLCDLDPEQAKAAILDFSQFLRGNMNSLTSKTPIPFAQELDHTRNYLDLEQRRFQARLQIRYEIEVQDFVIPPLTLQPLVENAVRHGVLRRETGGTVTIRTAHSEDAWYVLVVDDGVGFDPAEQAQGDRIHVGISNVRERLAGLCGGTLELHSAPGAGTTAMITIPKGGNGHELSHSG